MYDSLAIGTDLTFKNSKSANSNFNFFGCIPINAIHGNIGLTANLNRLDSTNTNTIGLIYAYSLSVGPGILLMADRINVIQYRINSDSKTIVDFDFGIFYKTHSFNFGLSANNLKNDSIKLNKIKIDFRRELNFYAGRTSTVYNNIFDDNKDLTMLTSFLYSFNTDKSSLIVNNTFSYSNFQFGLGYKYDYDYNHLALVNAGYSFANNFKILLSSYLPFNRNYLKMKGNNIELIAVYEL